MHLCLWAPHYCSAQGLAFFFLISSGPSLSYFCAPQGIDSPQFGVCLCISYLWLQ